MDKKLWEAKASLLGGLAVNFFEINPIKALILTAIIYGLLAPFLIAILLHICNDKKIMGKFYNGLLSNILGCSALLLMSLAAISLLILHLFLKRIDLIY